MDFQTSWYTLGQGLLAWRIEYVGDHILAMEIIVEYNGIENFFDL